MGNQLTNTELKYQRCDMLGEGGVLGAKACQGLAELHQQDPMHPCPHLVCVELDELNGCLLKRGA